jgi:peptide deformylase
LLQIVNYPHPALRYPSRAVTEIDDALRATIDAMFDLMYAAKGIGLAANQVNLPFRFFVLNLTSDPAQEDKELVFINPEIVKRHSSVEEEEGCLSLPGIYAPVWRARRIRVQAYDLEGNLVEHEADELFSRAIQHESDHLEGKLFIDHIDPLVRHSHGDKLRSFETKFRKAQQQGEIPPDDELVKRLDQMKRPSPDSSAVEAPG